MSYLFPDSRLIVFTKAPEIGKVKSRLIPHLGMEGATNLHQKMLENKLKLVTASRIAPVDLYCSPDMNHGYFQQLEVDFNLTLFTQTGTDLGRRMANAMEYTLKEHAMAVIIGTDCPALGHEYLLEAFQALQDKTDAVIGPADDGGYVLLGLRRFNAEIFADIEWGSEQVYAQTMSRLKRLGFSTSQLTSLWDVDRPEDLEKYHEYLAVHDA